MREIESKPIPLKSKGLTGDLKRLRQPTDSFLIANKGLKRAVLYTTASRLGIRLLTQAEGDGLRVWRNFDVENAVGILTTSDTVIPVSDEVPMTRQEKLDNLRAMIADPTPFVQPQDEGVDEWQGWSDERVEYDQVAGDDVTYREHLKTRKRTEIRRETHFE